MPEPTPVRPTHYDVARDRMTRLGILAFSLKKQTDAFRAYLQPPQPLTLRELGTRLKTQQQSWWAREWTRTKAQVQHALSRLRARV